MRLRPGDLLDQRYRLIEPLGEGGMGRVWVAEHVELAKRVALKLLRPELGAYPELVTRFRNEARLTSAIDHPNVVRVSDFGRAEGGELYLVMELLDGNTLYDELLLGPPTRSRALFIAIEVARGLEAAHAAGVVHRDLKPENVIIVKGRGPDGGDAIKVVDFGLARLDRDGGGRLTKSGTVMGTPLYMAPEQARGATDVDARADVYSLGVMLYELLTGRAPYQGSTAFEIAHAVLEGRPTPIEALVPDADPALVAVVMKALAGDRAARFPSATALREALERLRHGPLLGPGAAAPAPARASQLVDLPRGRQATTVPASPEARPARAPRPPTLDLDTDSAVPIPPARPNPPQRRASSVHELAAEPDVVALALDRPEKAAPAPPRRRRRWPLFFAGALVAVLAGLGAWMHLRARPPPPTEVHVEVAGLPRGGRVFADNREVPPRFALPGGRAPVRLRLEAPGHAARLLLLKPDADQTVDGRLDRSR